MTQHTNQSLGLITGKELFEHDFPDPNWAVEGIIPEGLTILAGRPKVGKSLLCLDIAYAVASGTKAFGSIPATKGKSVYFALEDPHRRIKQRMQIMQQQGLDNFLLSQSVKQIGTGFEGIVNNTCGLHHDARIFLVDTMQKIIPFGAESYEYYYNFLSPIQKMAHRLGVAIVLVTHARKSTRQNFNADNPFDEIIGSVAIQAVADCVIMCERKPSETDGILRIVGREMDDGNYKMRFDKEKLLWTLEDNLPINSSNENHQIIAKIIKESDEGLRPKDIISTSGLKEGTVKSCLKRMTEKGQLAKHDGVYTLSQP